MTELEQFLYDFRRDVERAEHLLQLVKSFREFGASSPPAAVLDGTAPWPQALALSEASELRRTDLPVLSGSLLLYLAGRFEYFVRQVVRSVADDIAANATNYLDLPETLRAELKNRTLEVAQSPRRYGFDETQADALLATLVGNLFGGVGPLSIGSDVLSITESNMKDRVLADLMKRVGMTDFWREIGKQATVKLFMEKRADSETTLEAQTRLNKIMDERNQIAHPTAATQFPDPDQVLGSAGFLKVIAGVTVDILRVYLSNFRPVA